MANLTAEQYDTLQEILKVIAETRQTFESLSESRAKRVANPIGPHKTHISSPITPMTPPQSPQPPDPPDYKPNLTSKSIANKNVPLKYSGEEIYERMEIGLCIFCDEQDIPGHYQLKHKRSQILMIECEDDKEAAHQIQETMMIPEKTADSVSDVLLVHRMDSHVKEVEESSQKSTSGSGKNIAHQLFDQMPSKEKQRKCLKAWKFKFKPTSKRSKSMDVEFFSVEEIAWFTKDSKEINWGCVNEEFKEAVAGCGKKRFDRLKIVDETSKPSVYDGPIQNRVWDSGGSPLEHIDEESYGDDKSSEVIAAETIVKLMHKPLMDNKYSFGDESSGKDVKVLAAQQGFMTQVCFGFNLKALIGLEIYNLEYKKQRKLEKSPFQHTYAAQIKRCGETTRQIDFFTDQMSKIRVLVKQMLVKENDIYLDNVEASEFFSSAHGSDMAPQREIKSQQASEDLLESPLLQEEKSIDSTKQIIIWIIFKELCSAGFERENETIKKSFKGLSKVEKDHKIEATVLVFLRHIFGIEHKITSGWIKYQEQGAKYEWSLFLQALQAVKDHKNTNYVTNTAILGVKRKYDPHGRLKEDMSLGSLTQKHHNKWGILTGTEIFSYNGVIIQVMVQRQWETFVMMLLSIAESLILLSDPFIFAEKKGIEISISCCYGTSSVDMQFSTAFEIMSKQQRFIQLPNLPRESSHDDADEIVQKREEHITSSARNVAVTKALIQWKEHPPDQIKDSQMYVLVSENQCQDYSPLLFLDRIKDSFEFMLMVEHFENPLVSILTQEVFHSQKPPEISTKALH